MIGILVAIAAGVVILAGLALAAWALFADRSRGRPRCPKCWYSMHGASGLRCPECGHVVWHQRELYRTRRRLRWAAAGLILAVAPAGYATVSGAYGKIIAWLTPEWTLIEEHQLGAFAVRRYAHRSGRPERVVVDLNGERHLTFTGYIAEAGVTTPGGQRVGLGDDINADGVPDLVIREYSGGAHCCTTLYVFSLEAGPFGTVRPDAVIRAEHGGCELADLDGDGAYEFSLHDWTFAYWYTSFAGSPAPKVILRCAGVRYQLAQDLMLAEPPSAEVFAARVASVLADEEWAAGRVSPSYWAEMLDLIYTGHADLAWRFAEQAWPPGREGREAFLDEFREQLALSPYWAEVMMIGKE